MPIDSKFEFKVVTDKDGRPVHLENMPIEAAKAFLTFYQTLVNLAESSEGNESPRIGIKPGSAVASVVGETAERINRDFESVASGQCINPDIVKQWREVQSQVQANGLSYEINHITANGVVNLQKTIKESKVFIKKPIKSQYSNSIKFFSGSLINVGGTLPNIHVLISPKNKITIDCEKDIAVRATNYLYKPILVAVWAKEAYGTRNAYELCDIYSSEEEYNTFKSYFEELEGGDKITSLTSIHRRIKSLLAEGDFNNLRKLLKLWMHATTDIQTLKIILVITKAFRDDKRISQYIDKFQEYFKAQEVKLSKQSKSKKRA